jgi:serine/threonine protein phosphatase PrpC
MNTSTYYEITGVSIPLKGKNKNGDHFKHATAIGNAAVLVVADGVGSAPCDHLASELSCTLTVAELLRTSTEAWPVRIEAAIRAANSELLLQDGTCAGLKCTVVLAVWDPVKDELHFTSLGDSRLYARRAGRWEVLTTDQRKAVVRRGRDGKPLRMAGAIVVAVGVTHVLGVHLSEPVLVSTI